MEWIPGRYERRRRGIKSSIPMVIEILERRALLADGIAPQPGPQLVGKPGVPFTNVPVASFTVTDPSGSPGTKWNAEIIWGDGSPISKRVPATAGPNSTFQILDTHTYNTAGTFTITVMIAVPGSHLPNDNIVTTTAVVQNPATLSSIKVTPANPSLSLGTMQQFTATGTFSDSSTQDVTAQVAWSSSNPAAATINGGGLVTAVAPGTSVISATLNGVTGFTGLTVSTATLTSIVVSPANPTIAFGGAQQFTAAGTFSDKSVRDLTAQVAWSSSTPAVAAISSTGLATGVAQGTTTITAALNDVAGSTTATVSPAPPPPFPVVGLHFRAKVFKTFNRFVSYFKEPHTKTRDFHAVIDWGDNSKKPLAHIHSEGDGRYAVVGMHRYVKPGVYHVTVTVRDPHGRKAETTTLINVST
jgi:uncharacterized protein YjdB